MAGFSGPKWLYQVLSDVDLTGFVSGDFQCVSPKENGSCLVKGYEVTPCIRLTHMIRLSTLPSFRSCFHV